MSSGLGGDSVIGSMTVGFWLFLRILPVLLLAHPLDLGLLSLEIDVQKTQAQLDLNPKAAASLLGLTENQLSSLTIEGHTDALMKATLAQGVLMRGEKSCAWKEVKTEWRPETVRLTAVAACPPSVEALHAEFAFIRQVQLAPTFELMVRSRSGNNDEQVDILTKEKTNWVSRVGTSRGWFAFILMGMQHIGATVDQWVGPQGVHLPEGIDHLLFLVALVLGGGTMFELLKTVTGFTIGHSVTLALATLGVVTLPSRFVESCIALSIVFLASQAFLKRGSAHRWKLTALFGLIHGLGFANALRELSLEGGELLRALVGFNLGVEMGQALLLAIFVPLFAWLRSTQSGTRFALPACSFSILIISTYWFIQRAFGI